MKSLLEILQRAFEYIIIDSPPILAVTDPVIMSTQVDSVLLVAAAGQTRRNQLVQAAAKLDGVKAKTAGVVLNRLDGQPSEYYYYYQYAEEGLDEDSPNGKVNGATEQVPVYEDSHANGSNEPREPRLRFFSRRSNP